MAIKAIYTILIFNFNYKEAFKNEGGKEEKTFKEKMKEYTMEKLKDQSRDFKYNFFIRMVLEIFLQVCIIALLNIRFAVFVNKTHVFSFLFSVGLVIAMLIFMGLILIYLMLNYS